LFKRPNEVGITGRKALKVANKSFGGKACEFRYVRIRLVSVLIVEKRGVWNMILALGGLLMRWIMMIWRVNRFLYLIKTRRLA
jgi:hypothetical protein